MSDTLYELNLSDSYTGPLDLLYLLMRKEEIPFEKISIAAIADQYLEYIKDLENVDLSYAGDFLSLASRLMALKISELLPKTEQKDNDLLDFEIEREALIAQMQEYQKFKRVARGLQELEGKNFGAYGRGRPEKIGKDDKLADSDIWQLFKSFHKSLQTHSYNNPHTIEVDNVTIEDRELHINNHLSKSGRAMFEDLLGHDKISLVAVVTFMALLELTKTEEIVFRQNEVSAPLWLYRKKQNDEYKEELAQEKIYYSPDPTVIGGLVDYLHDYSLAQETAEKTALDSILKNSMQLIENGFKITEEDVQNMLDGNINLGGERLPLASNASLNPDSELNSNISESGSRSEFTATPSNMPIDISLLADAMSSHLCPECESMRIC